MTRNMKFASRSVRSPRVRMRSMLGAWFEAGHDKVVDGKIEHLKDWCDPSHLLEQTDTTKQVAAAVADAALNGALSATFTGTQFYRSNRPASAWRHLHSGAGFDAIITYVPDANTVSTGAYTFLSTCKDGSFASQRGLFWGLTVSGGQRATLRVAAANASRVVNSADKTFGGLEETPRFARASYMEGASPEFLHGIESVVLDFGSSDIAPATGDPATTLILGADDDGATILAKYRFHSLFLSRPGTRFSPTELAAITEYIEDVTGIMRPTEEVAEGRTRAVVVGLGESLMVGTANRSSLPAGYPPINGKVKRFDDSDKWHEMSEPADDPGANPIYSTIRDPEVGTGYMGMFCSDLQDLLEDEYEVGLANCGRSGSRSWDWAVGGAMLNEAIAKAQSALSMPGTQLSAICLDQGVNDTAASVDPDGKTWTQRWNEAEAAFRAGVHDQVVASGIDPDDVVLYYRQHPDDGSGNPETIALRAEQAAWENLSVKPYRVMWVGNNGPYIGGGTGPHYNNPGNIIAGLRLFDRYQEVPSVHGLGPPPPVLTGLRALSGFDTSTVLGTEAGELVVGSALTGVGMGILVRCNAVPTVLERLCEQQSGLTGFVMRSNGATLQLTMGNGLTSVFAGTRVWTLDDVGKDHLIFINSSLAAASSWMNGAPLGSAALAGYSPASTKSLVWGSTDGGNNPALSFSMIAGFCRDTPFTTEEMEAIWAASQAGDDLDMAGVTVDHRWRVPLTEDVPDTIEDEVGSNDITFQQGATTNLTLVEYEEDDVVWGSA